MGGIGNVLDQSEHDFIALVESESAGSDEEVSGVSLSHAGVGVETEELVQFSDVFGGEDWVLGDEGFAEDVLEFVGFNFSFGH